jgi:NAD-dependent SIR2 family protein deacetylase
MQNYLDNLNKTAKLIEEADYILIGAGAGLSAAAGLNYGDKELFTKWFPSLAEQGIETIGEACSIYWEVNDSNRREFWAYWSKHIRNIRYETPALKAYLDLFDKLKNKSHFIITTNVDGQFEKAGFDKEKIFAPQGDYGLFQCEKPCSDELFDNKTIIDKMTANINYETFSVREEDIPRCAKCGGFLVRNLRIDDIFVEAPHMTKQKDYIDFVNNSTDGRLVLLELGVGFNTPGIIRWPFERIAKDHPNAKLIRMNRYYAEVPKELEDKSISFNESIEVVISDLKL